LATAISSAWSSTSALAKAAKSSPTDKENAPPVFFLQDTSDGQCLSGEGFARCSIDTLFYVVGTPGQYQIHKRPMSLGGDTSASNQVKDELDDNSSCITIKNCNDDNKEPQELKLGKCTHCGAKAWNILGDANTGYVLTEGDGKLCVRRDTATQKAMTVSCDLPENPYTAFQLQFAQKADIEAMSSPAARFINAATQGDKKTIQSMLKEEQQSKGDGEAPTSLVNSKDWDGLTPLSAAAASGHLEICKLLVKEGANVNASDKDKVTPLMEASLKGHTKIVDFLLSQAGENSVLEVDAKAQSGITALWLASSAGHAETVKALLKQGADPSNVRVDGITALATAAVSGHDNVVAALLEAGADGMAKTEPDALTPLMNSAESGSVATLKVLHEHNLKKEPETKGEIDHMSQTGFTALIIAAAHGHADACKYLVEQGADVNAMHEQGVTALMYAAAAGKIDTMKVLIDVGGADVNKKHSNGGSALLEACAGGSKEAIELLIEKGADFKIVDNDGVSPLMSASSQAHLETVKLLLNKLKESGESEEEIAKLINTPSFSGGTSVMFSAHAGSVEITQLLLEHGADISLHAQATPEYLENYAKAIEDGTIDVNAEDFEHHVDGVTALTVAAQKGHLEVCKLLLENGADIHAKDDEDRTALLMAVAGNFGELATLLISKGADPNTVYVDDENASHNLLMDAIIVENEDFASLLITSGADIYHVDDTKVSTLLQASHRGLEGIVASLLEKHESGGDAGSIQSKYIDYPSEEGITPLIAAASEGHTGILNLLISAKADVNAKDKDGTTALMAASARGHLEAVKALIDAGASVNEQNDDGHSALMFAYNGKTQVETLWERYTQLLSENNGQEDQADDGSTGPIIQEALANHTNLVNFLIEKGADASLKDKEGHVAADFDYHPDLDSEVIEKEEMKEKMRESIKNEL